MEELLDEAPTTSVRKGATRVRYAVLASACALALVTYVHRLGFAVGAPAIKRDLGFNDEQIGYLFSAFFWAYGGFQVLGGWLGDRLGSRHLLCILVLGWSLATGAVALVSDVPVTQQLLMLVILRFLFGAFQAGGFPLLSRVNADWMPVTMRGTSQGLIWMSSRLGGALIPLLLTPMFVWFGTWRTPFWVISSLGLVWCAAFWPWFRNTPQESPYTNSAERDLIVSGRASRKEGRNQVPWSLLLGSRSAWCLCLAYGFMGFSSNFYIGQLPTYLTTQRHYDADTVKWLTSLPMACGVVACISGGAFSDWLIRKTGSRAWGRRLNGTISMAVAALAFSSTILVQDKFLLAFLLSLTFVCNDLSMAPAWASCADIGERCAGTLGGAMNTMANLGGAVSALVAGFLFHHERPSAVFLIFSGSYLLACLSWFGVNADKPLVTHAEADPSVA